MNHLVGRVCIVVTQRPRTKAEWRERALQNRRGLVADSARIRWHLGRFLRSQTIDGWILTFDPMPGEIDLRPLLDSDIGRFALTRTPSGGRSLTVHSVDGDLESHRFGYRQPMVDAAVIDDASIDVVLVPGLAFDHRGHRLGRGAGYYDRLLARLRPDVLRIGVSDGFVVSELPIEEHDIAMTHLAGEVGVVATPFGS